MPFFDGVDGAVYYKAWRAADPRAYLWALDEIGHGLTYGERGDAVCSDTGRSGARALDR